MFRRFAAAFLAFAVFAAAPHVQTVSYPIFTIFEKEIHATVRVKIVYFTDVVAFAAPASRGVDAPSITAVAARAHEKELVNLVTKAFGVSTGEVSLAPVFENIEYTFLPTGPEAVDEAIFHYHFSSAEKLQSISLRYKLFADHDPNHRGIAKIRRGVSEKTFIFRRDDVFYCKVDEIGPESAFGAAFSFFIFGMEHIFNGYDHLLFLAGLLVAARALKSLFWIVTSFTIAHSVTLVSAALGWLSISPSIVEPAIAASVLFVGIENLLRKNENNKRWMLSGAFGLVHGLGFAGFVNEANLPPGATAVSLGSFNLGVEAAQATLLCIAFPILTIARERLAAKVWNYYYVTISLAIAAAGGFWLITRLITI